MAIAYKIIVTALLLSTGLLWLFVKEPPQPERRSSPIVIVV